MRMVGRGGGEFFWQGKIQHYTMLAMAVLFNNDILILKNIKTHCL
jgi:hypothetical protein